MALENTFRVAIFDEFLDALVRIPRAQQKKVNKFVRMFREDPTNPSINYESISTFADQNLRTVRIDQAYRAIVLKPQKGNVYVLLWVDNHDEAMRWAQNKRVSIHPDTGAMQVLSAAPAPEAEPGVAAGTGDGAAATATSDARPALFAHVRDRELQRLGVPPEMLGAVRAMGTPEDVTRARELLPPEAWEALVWLADGESLEEVEKAMVQTPAAPVDTGDFAAALERDATRRRFVLVDDDEMLEAMLDAPLEKWRVFLHPQQRALVDRSWNGPVRVLGGAGTGKTVVAMHRAVHLAAQIHARLDDRILFTTFTTNLAADIDANLAKLCGPEVRRRIEVVSLDEWVARQLRRAGYDYAIRYWGRDAELEDMWGRATLLAPQEEGFAESFYRDEWELVVQPAGCTSEADYVAASRTGRGVRMSRRQRRAVWPVFEEYRNLLDRAGVREPEDALRDAATLMERGDLRSLYRAVVVDEAQDMSTAAFALLRRVVPEGPDDLFIVGDGHQRIYRRRVVLAHAGVNIVGRSHRLRLNYRTTDEIRACAVALIEGVEIDDLDDGSDSVRGYRSLTHGSPPEVSVHPTFDEEVAHILRWIEDGTPERTCLVARTRAQVERYAKALEAAGVATHRLRGSTPDNPARPGLRVATMHRVKGLEYDAMIIAGLNADALPLRHRIERTDDPSIRRDAEQMERSLLYVALTRARHAALITASGEPSPLIAGMA